MNIWKTGFTYLACIISTLGLGQHIPDFDLIASAERDFKNFAYTEAAGKFEMAHSRDSSNLFVLQRLADSYIKLNNSQKAERWLALFISADSLHRDDYLFHYAEMLSRNQKYEESQYWFEQLSKDRESERKVFGIRNLSQFFKDQELYQVEKKEWSSDQSDFAPTIYNGNVVFVSSRKKKTWVSNDYNWDQSEYLDFYEFEPFEDSFNISKIESLNSKYHEGPGQFYSNEGHFVFTRNITKGKRLGRNEQGVTKLQILFARKDSLGEWTDFVPFEHNSTTYSVGHPAISEDGLHLFFASDMPGGYGKTDLYYSRLNADSSWSAPINLGENVNTGENELFPTLFKDRLCFASDGREGLGGLDIFSVELRNFEVAGVPANLGYPLSSSQDDFAIAFLSESGGYFSSNRLGTDDIFEFRMDYLHLQGQVLVVNDESPAAGAEVVVLANTEPIAQVKADEKGQYEVKVPWKDNFQLIARKQDYELVDTMTMVLRKGTIPSVEPLYLGQKIINLSATDAGTNEVIEDAIQIIKPLTGKNSLRPIGTHSHKYVVKESVPYEVVSVREGYYTERDTFLFDLSGGYEQFFNARLREIVVGESIRLDHIYYDLNSDHLRPESETELDKLVVFMEDNSHIVIELSSHTDAQGSSSYNLRLSQRRAESASEYLKSHGIAESRIVPKGYGEEKLVNRCQDGVKCTPEEHQENRRTEIRILSND